MDKKRVEGRHDALPLMYLIGADTEMTALSGGRASRSILRRVS